MNCFNHKDREAAAQCRFCGKGVCDECAVPLGKGRGTACSSITSDASSVYFVCSDSMYQCPLAGCGAQGPWLLTTGVQSTGGMVNDAAAIYWVASSGAIMKVAK